jgi:GntR family transcriptional regulator, transcriptional repressor for pyruvate dehydrogenase complex
VDGDILPRQEDLIRQFGVSPPPVREALRLLEAEGLVRVRRGKAGGAVVRRPLAQNAAYMLDLVLQSRGVPADDVYLAIRLLEPVCAELCAMRSDRHAEVLPRLVSVHEEARDAIDDLAEFTRASRRFHEELVACCGNETIILLLGALESTWSARAVEWSERSVLTNSPPDLEFRRRGFEDHELLLQLIARGDAEIVNRVAREHLASSPVYTTDEAHAMIEPAALIPTSRPAASLDHI